MINTVSLLGLVCITEMTYFPSFKVLLLNSASLIFPATPALMPVLRAIRVMMCIANHCCSREVSSSPLVSIPVDET